MSGLLRGSRRSYALDVQKRNHKRDLVLKALEKRQKDQAGDRLLTDIIAAVPRSTDRHIDEVIKKVRKENEQDAIKLEAALASCRELHENLSGAKPNMLWTDPVRLIWLEAIETVTAQTSRWKACPLVMVHPYVGTVEVVISLCGKHQAQNEFSRMRLFAEDLRVGLDEILNDIHPIKDDDTGNSLPFEETKEILLNISGQAKEEEEDQLSEDNLSEDDNNSDDYERIVERVSGDWTSDKIDREPATKSRLISSPKKSSKSPNARSLEIMSLASTTPPLTARDQSRSSLSDFESPINDNDSSTKRPPATKPKQPSPPLPKLEPAPQKPKPMVNRSLFSDRQVTYTPAPWQSTIQVQPEPNFESLLTQNSPPTSPARSNRTTSDLSEVYPDGYTVIPVRNSKTRKSDGRKPKDQKKRPVSSPNLPSTKQSRMDRTEMAIEQIQVNQANQNEILQKLASQLGQFSVALAMQKSNLDPK